jgi:hypothetical protein
MLYLLASEQLLLSQSAAHYGDSWAAVFMLYLLSSEQLLLSQSAAHRGDSWAAVFMLYLLASEQLLLSQSAAHHGDSWAAVFLCCTYLHLSSFSCPSLPRTTVTAGQLFFMLYLLASEQLLLSQSAAHRGDS